MSEKKETEYRTRNWATIVYKDSAPENWLEILSDELVPCIVSPYHDSDVNPTGEVKKAHWHVIIIFDSVKSERQARFIFDKIHGVGCQAVNSIRGYARYLLHLDNPEKHLYNRKDIITMYGVDYDELISLESDKYPILDEIIHFIDNHNITSFYLLAKYAYTYNESWKRILTDQNTVFIKEYLKSRKWSVENNNLHIINVHGEIII